LRNARDDAVSTGKDFWIKLKNQPESVRDTDDATMVEDPEGHDNRSSGSGLIRPEAPPAASGSGEGPEIGVNTRSARITINRLIEIGPTIGVAGVYCRKCEEDIGKHSQGCRARFNSEYKKAVEASPQDKPEDLPEAAVASGTSAEHTEPPLRTEESEEIIAAAMCELQTMNDSYQAPEKVLHCDADAETIDAMVTRLLDRSEAMSNPKALEAIHKEADGLLAKGTWDLNTVREKDDVMAEARANKEKTHIGSLMTICSEKFAELEEQFRVLKGRVVYRGDSAKDEEGAAAIYQNLSASPTSIRGMNANIAYGRVPGHKTTSADAVKAYVQAVLKCPTPHLGADPQGAAASTVALQATRMQTFQSTIRPP
jgi:hypothetical protein